MKYKIAGYPALIVTTIGAALNLAVGFGLPLTRAEVGLVNAAVAAVAAAVVAFNVRPYPVPLLVGAADALLSLAIGFGAHIAADQVSLINAAILVGAAWFTHQAVSPVAVPNGSPSPASRV